MTAGPPSADASARDAARLAEFLSQFDGAAVAFSGGVDSAVVAKAAALAFGDRAVAVTGTGPALSAEERETARRVAAEIGIRHVEVDPGELSDGGYVANAGDRCYFCKRSLYRVSAPVAERMGLPVVLNGTNADDLGDYRPGLAAASEAGVRSPLAECGLDKAAVRRLAAMWGLSVRDKPASPCLASRIAPGVEVTRDRLAMVEAGEAAVRRRLGVAEFRVRLEAGDLARIELPPDALVAAVDSRGGLVADLTAAGFRRVTLDLAGFESGNLNALVPLRTP